MQAKSWMACMRHVARCYVTRGFQEEQEAKFQQRAYGQVLLALFRRTLGPYQRDYYTSANHEDFQGVKDPRGPVGIRLHVSVGIEKIIIHLLGLAPTGYLVSPDNGA
jgi:hypothetical protein